MTGRAAEAKATANVRLPQPVRQRLVGLAERLTDEKGRFVSLGEVIEIALDRAQMEEDQR